MKKIRKLIRIPFGLIGIILLILIIDYIRLNAAYLIHKKEYKETIDVQGNKNNYIPQGLAYSSKYNVVLQTSYNSKKKGSKLYITDFKTNKLIKELFLINQNGEKSNLHVGGIATDNEKVWITNDYKIEEYSLEEIMNTNQDKIKNQKEEKIPTRGDFCTYKNNKLWIGDFFLNPFYKVPDNNPLLMRYTVEDEINFQSPEVIISLPKMVQGMVITEKNHFLFTTSFTNLIQSELLVYDNVLKKKKETYNLNGKKIDYYKFTKEDKIKTMKLPPMAEGMFFKNNELYILFENSSNTYFYAYPKMKKIIKLKKEKYDF